MTSLRASIIHVGRGTDDDGWERDVWSVNLAYKGRTMHTTFHTGTALGKPAADDVLESLFSDAQGVEYDGFEDWADNYGMDSDSRKAEAMYHAIEEQTERLRAFCGDDYDRMSEAFAEINA